MKNTKNQKIKTFILNNLIIFIVTTIVLLIAFYVLIAWVFWTSENNLFSKYIDEEKTPIEELVKKENTYFKIRNETLVLVNEDMEIVESKGDMSEEELKRFKIDYMAGITFDTEFDYFFDDEKIIYEVEDKIEYNGEQVRGVIVAKIGETFNKKVVRISVIFGIANIAVTLLVIILLVVIIMNRIYKRIELSFNFIGKSLEDMPYSQQKIDAKPNDFVETKKIVSSFNTMIDEMTRINKEKKEVVEQSNRLISNLSHDLKSPLTSIKGYSEILANEELTSKEISQYAKYINNSVMDLDYLANMLFEQIKFKNADYALDVKHLDINEFIRDICANYYTIFQNRGFDLMVDIGEDILKVDFDPYNFKRVITNILDNAYSHNKDYTNVFVSVKEQEDYVVISIKDDGTGIPEQSQKKIFEPFYQVDSSRSKNKSGLGLYVAKQIMEKHCGSIELTSDTDYTTCFKVNLPNIKES